MASGAGSLGVAFVGMGASSFLFSGCLGGGYHSRGILTMRYCACAVLISALYCIDDQLGTWRIVLIIITYQVKSYILALGRVIPGVQFIGDWVALGTGRKPHDVTDMVTKQEVDF